MKKNKDTKEKSHWQKLISSPSFLKNIKIYSILSFIFILSISILIYRYINKPITQPEFVFQKPVPVTASKPIHAPAIGKLQNDHLTHLEGRINELQAALQMLHQLVALEMLQAILDGHLPLKTFTAYLQKTSEPWTTDVLKTLIPIKESKTYDQLQALLILQPQSQPPSFWKRVKNTLRSFVRIRKLDKEGNEKLGNLEEMQIALQTHNIQKALGLFGKLPPQEQAQLVLWKQGAQDRLTLEKIKLKILLELSKE